MRPGTIEGLRQGAADRGRRQQTASRVAGGGRAAAEPTGQNEGVPLVQDDDLFSSGVVSDFVRARSPRRYRLPAREDSGRRRTPGAT